MEPCCVLLLRLSRLCPRGSDRPDTDPLVCGAGTSPVDTLSFVFLPKELGSCLRTTSSCTEAQGRWLLPEWMGGAEDCDSSRHQAPKTR